MLSSSIIRHGFEIYFLIVFDNIKEAVRQVDSDEAYVHGFESLHLLNLDENQFDSWHELLKLSRLKRCMLLSR